MKKNDLLIEGIPAILWGEHSEKLFIAVHGNMSCKDDNVIVILAEEAIAKGYQVLSFDLPEHGERKDCDYVCNAQNCVTDLTTIIRYVRTITSEINAFGCSMGAYFSLLAYRDVLLKQALFLSPVLNMERLINNMMTWFNISEEKLAMEKEIETPIGQTLYWDYYCYVKSHPIDTWHVPTSILYGSADNLTPANVVTEFVERFHCNLQIMKDGEHYFHTDEQLGYYRDWLGKTIC